VQPGNAAETRAVVRWAVEQAEGDVAIRLAIGPSPRSIALPSADVVPGRGHVLVDGDAALLVAYGPVLLHEALLASEALRGRGVRVAVASMPWLNRIDADWLAGLVAPYAHVLVVEDHAPVGALGDALRRTLAERRLDQGRTVEVAGVDGWPACGTPPEALRAHGLDAASLAARTEGLLGAPAA
jgi:transketolase